MVTQNFKTLLKIFRRFAAIFPSKKKISPLRGDFSSQNNFRPFSAIFLLQKCSPINKFCLMSKHWLCSSQSGFLRSLLSPHFLFLPSFHSPSLLFFLRKKNYSPHRPRPQAIWEPLPNLCRIPSQTSRRPSCAQAIWEPLLAPPSQTSRRPSCRVLDKFIKQKFLELKWFKFRFLMSDS